MKRGALNWPEKVGFYLERILPLIIYGRAKNIP